METINSEAYTVFGYRVSFNLPPLPPSSSLINITSCINVAVNILYEDIVN